MKNADKTLPPTSFNILRELPLKMGRGDLDLPMGKQSYRALCQMLDDPEQVAMGNISSLARELEVSAATLSRLARQLGFTSFGAFQDLFRQHLLEPDRFYSAQAKRLVDRQAASNMDVLRQVAEQANDNIQRGLMQLDTRQVGTAVEWLAGGVHIHLFGYRQSASIASFMCYALMMIRGNVQQLGNSGHGLSVGLAQISRNDIVVLVSSAPYSRETLSAARLARRQHARIIAITDSHLSPLAQWADIILTVPTDSVFYSNSFSAAVFLIEGLSALVAKRLGRRAVANLEAREQLIADLNDRY